MSTVELTNMTTTDLLFVMRRIPKDVRELIAARGLAVAGGFIRAIIAGERPDDLDLFGPTKEIVENAALTLAAARGVKLHETQNALTIAMPGRMTIQFITRWTYRNELELYNVPTVNMTALLNSFDFTIAQAGITFQRETRTWVGLVTPGFYPDLAARRLVYTTPVRIEEVGGSTLRVRKFLARGYNIQAGSLGKVIARLVTGVKFEDRREITEDWLAKIITALLREVDPSSVIDGIEVPDDPTVENLEAAGLPGVPEAIL